MKKTHLLSLALACMLSVTQTVLGQKVTREEWRKQIQAQEMTINDYVEQKLRGQNQEGLLKEFYATVEHVDEIKKADLPKILDQYLKDRYRAKYFEENPKVISLYNPGRVQMQSQTSSNAAAPAPIRSVACFNGDFESDPSLADYTGFRGPMYTGNECTFVPAGPVAYTAIGLGSVNEYSLTNNAPDALIPALNQTNNGSAHAVRINGPGPCTPNRGINMLQRSFATPTAGPYQISFSYALVMENPKGHGNAQPFFVARVLNGAGVEVGSRICRVSDLTNPIYNITGSMPNPTGCGTTDSLVWRDWTCASISFQGDPTQTYTIEFFAADCAAGAHFGYAYIDDICASQCCPKFFMRDCCDMHGGSHSSGATARQSVASTESNKLVEKILGEYNARMALKYNFAANRAAAAIDPCCNPCAYPNDPYPVFIMDEFNTLISSTDYVISWSHDPGNTSAYSFLLPNQQTIITVKGPGNCVWTDTLKLNCCSDTIKITPFCTWDPCDFPNSPFAVRVQDQNGNILTSAGGYTFQWYWTTGSSTGDAITATLANYPIMVKVKYPNGCEYTDTLRIECCKANTPKNPKCNQVTGGSNLSWDLVPGATYKLVITTNDPTCCPQGIGASYVLPIAATSTVIPSSFAPCFSWYVIAVCADGTESPATVKMCSCSPPVCNPKVPDNLRCTQVSNGSLISWTAVPGMTYKVIINSYDPACCHSTIPPTSSTFTIAATNTVIPTTLVNCFSWQVIAVCPNGTQSAASAKVCSCSPPPCVATTPINLKCVPITSGSQISWDPVPGATYKVVINVNDPACCPQGLPQSTISWNVASTGTVVPSSTANCFSWYVIAICPDGSQSQASGKKCSCTPVACVPKTPINLKCVSLASGSQISWDPIPGATYQVIITTNDPACCHTNQPGFSMVWNVATTNTIVPTTVAGCFSWYVIAICPDGSQSQASVKVCSCSPQISCIPKTPINLKCFANLSGSNISWDPIPGATYKVIITTYDPACCAKGGLGMSMVWNVAGTSTVVPTSVASCFSWYVIAICPDGSQSPASVKVCSCSPIIVAQCPDPNNLRCAVIQNQTRLTWVGGGLATGYEVEITYDDPACCRLSTNLPTMSLVQVTSPVFYVPFGSWRCFSWRVRAICPGGYSNWISGGCNCSSVIIVNPTSRQGNTDDDNSDGPSLGNDIRVEAVPNPASDYVDFNLYGVENMKDQVMEIAMYDITGREVSRKTVPADAKVKFDVYSLSPGLYIYKLTSKGELFFSGKIMIDRK
jgi:hypothetical protein